jgi:predicted transposase YdaD
LQQASLDSGGRVARPAQTQRRKEIEAMLATTIQETRVYQDAKAEGRLEGEHALVLRLLTRKVGDLPSAILAQVQGLTLPQIEALGEALLDFTSLTDLQAWLNQNAPS